MTGRYQYKPKESFYDGATKPKPATPRLPKRSLSEFAAEVGVSVRWLMSMKASRSDFPKTALQSGATGYYTHAELKAWYAKHKVAAKVGSSEPRQITMAEVV